MTRVQYRIVSCSFFTSSLGNSLEQLEFLLIDARIDHRNQDAFNQAPQTRAGMHRRGNLDMRLLSWLERSHPEGRGDMSRGVNILLDQHPAWSWLDCYGPVADYALAGPSGCTRRHQCPPPSTQ